MFFRGTVLGRSAVLYRRQNLNPEGAAGDGPDPATTSGNRYKRVVTACYERIHSIVGTFSAVRLLTNVVTGNKVYTV
jgi:hypothetical protein